VEFLAVGATALALGTVLFGDPGAPDRVRAELAAEVETRGHASAAEISEVARQSVSPAT
jgi:dihydroorotate dehydrogenase